MFSLCKSLGCFGFPQRVNAKLGVLNQWMDPVWMRMSFGALSLSDRVAFPFKQNRRNITRVLSSQL